MFQLALKTMTDLRSRRSSIMSPDDLLLVPVQLEHTYKAIN